MLNIADSSGQHCKSKTGRQNQDQSSLATNHRRSWRDWSWISTCPRWRTVHCHNLPASADRCSNKPAFLTWLD